MILEVYSELVLSVRCDFVHQIDGCWQSVSLETGLISCSW